MLTQTSQCSLTSRVLPLHTWLHLPSSSQGYSCVESIVYNHYLLDFPYQDVWCKQESESGSASAHLSKDLANQLLIIRVVFAANGMEATLVVVVPEDVSDALELDGILIDQRNTALALS
jgi:hypothetical protein